MVGKLNGHLQVYNDVMHTSEPWSTLIRPISPGEPRARSWPCSNDSSTSRLQRRQDTLDSDAAQELSTAACRRPPAFERHSTGHSSTREATGSVGTLEYDGSRPGPVMMCRMVETLERVSEGVSEYTFTSPTRNHEAVVETSLVDEGPAVSSAAKQVSTQLTVVRQPCQVLRLAGHNEDGTAAREDEETATISADQSRLHNALQAQCVKLIHHASYSDIEDQFLPRGMCISASLIMSTCIIYLFACFEFIQIH